MKRILAFAGSNSSQSINKKLIDYTATLSTKSEIEVLDLTEFDAPVYSSDHQNEFGIPDSIHNFLKQIKNSDGFIIATPEHNGMITAFFKNLMDWLSRLERKSFENKPVIILGTSPGRGGAKRAIKNLETFLSDFAGNVIGTFSFPSFDHNFDRGENRIINEDLLIELTGLIKNLENELNTLTAPITN